MIAKTVKYKDYNGVEREEKHYFHLNETELAEMEYSTAGGMSEYLQRIVDADDKPELFKIFKELLLKSYGVRSADGRSFIKFNEAGVPLSRAFSQTEAFSVLFMELGTDDQKAAEFINGVIPSKTN